MTDHGVVDADGHVVEPRSVWDAVAEEHRPRIVADRHGYEHVVVGDTEILAVPLGTLATPGGRFSDPADFRPLEKAWPGGSDPRARLADMDSEGIDRAVLYPSVGLYVWAVPDPAAALAIARAYNDWLASYCAADPARLFGAAMRTPGPGPEGRRWPNSGGPDELGPRPPSSGPNPCLGRTLSHPDYEPLWEAAEDLGVTVGIHERHLESNIPTLGSDRPFNPLILHGVSHAFEQMLACAELIAFHGVLQPAPGSGCLPSNRAGAGPPSGWRGWTNRPRASAPSAPR